MSNRNIIIIVIIVLMLCVGGVGCVVCVATGLLADWMDGGLVGQAPPKIGETAPDFQLETIDGEPVSLSQYRGQPVMINFWATWCYPCREEMPLLQDRFEEHASRLVIIAIEDNSAIHEVREFVEQEGLTFLVVQDTTRVQQQYGVTAFPTSFFVDAEGIVQSQVVGGLSGNYLDAELAKIGLGD